MLGKVNITVPSKSKLTVRASLNSCANREQLIENRVDERVSRGRKQQIHPWQTDFSIILHWHNTTRHGLFARATVSLRSKQDQVKRMFIQGHLNQASFPHKWALLSHCLMMNLQNAAQTRFVFVECYVVKLLSCVAWLSRTFSTFLDYSWIIN